MSLLPAWLPFDPRDEFRLGPRVFPGRVWTASGCFGYGLDGHDITSPGGGSPLDGVGAVVTKTVTLAPRHGNLPPRIWDAGPGALNSIGLENVGLDRFLDEIAPALEANAVPFVASIAGTEPAQFGVMTRRLRETAAGFAHWHGVELNLSCPNVAEGGVDFGRDPATVRACVQVAAGETGDRALLAKLTPNAACIAELAQAAADGGAHGVTAINTLIGMDIDLNTGRPVLPGRRGGYSGPAILPVALAKVDEIVRETGLPVVGVGGIRRLGDALKFFAVGAVAVQVGTAQMDNPFAAAAIASALSATD
ncbi:dihydroorotate dehydrogenase [bacterium]|nr:dihydroorotate dehydrogenase [bacterium]MBU1675489.1 dihydroorotate dehydrogenase [bacterium]